MGEVSQQFIFPLPVYVRFYNTTPDAVKIIWVAKSETSRSECKTRFVVYAVVRKNQFLDMKTYTGHEFVACRASDGLRMSINDQRSYIGELPDRMRNSNIIARIQLTIGYLNLSLVELSAFKVLSSEEVNINKLAPVFRDVINEVRSAIKLEHK